MKGVNANIQQGLIHMDVDVSMIVNTAMQNRY